MIELNVTYIEPDTRFITNNVQKCQRVLVLHDNFGKTLHPSVNNERVPPTPEFLEHNFVSIDLVLFRVEVFICNSNFWSIL